jgi:hypothetical protein
MDIVRMENISQAQVNHTAKIEKVQNTNSIDQHLEFNDKYKEVENREVDRDGRNSNDVHIVESKIGYNTASDIFFVEIEKDGVKYKFPTEDIMRLKAFLREEVRKLNNS